jgi:hypothetical protein
VSGPALWSVLRLRFTALSNKDLNPKKTGQAMNALACSELRCTMNERSEYLLWGIRVFFHWMNKRLSVFLASLYPGFSRETMLPTATGGKKICKLFTQF